MIPSPLMGEGQDEGENLGCRSKIDALRQRLRKVEEPPHLNPLPPGERKERKMGEGEDKGEIFTAHGSQFTDFGSVIAR
jgi:hypothetical protein